METHFTPLNIEHMCHQVIQKVAVMRNQKQGSGITLKPILKPDDGIEIKMVGRFVEQEHIGATHERLSHIESHPPTP